MSGVITASLSWPIINARLVVMIIIRNWSLFYLLLGLLLVTEPMTKLKHLNIFLTQLFRSLASTVWVALGKGRALWCDIFGCTCNWLAKHRGTEHHQGTTHTINGTSSPFQATVGKLKSAFRPHSRLPMRKCDVKSVSPYQLDGRVVTQYHFE